MTTPRKIQLDHARRLIISKQHLDASPVPDMLQVFKNLGCVQLDPISKVAKTHRLVLWSRLGNYDANELQKIRFEDKTVFEYWAHAASMVCTEDYPIHAVHMRHKREANPAWLDEHNLHNLKANILAQIHENGAMFSRDIEGDGNTAEQFSGWTTNAAKNRLLSSMWTTGELMVSNRKGNQREFDLAERFFPEWTPREELSEREASKRSIERAVKALGIARGKKHIDYHFTRHRYWDFHELYEQLQADGTLIPVDIGDGEEWVIHRDDLDLLAKIEAGDWQGRTVLLSPFDNLICDRDRTFDLWNFFFRIEIYVPVKKREFGYYVLPILHNDDLIGRMDVEYLKKEKTLLIISTYAEDGAPADAVKPIRTSVENLAIFLGANKVKFGKTIPAMWSGLKA